LPTKPHSDSIFKTSNYFSPQLQCGSICRNSISLASPINNHSLPPSFFPHADISSPASQPPPSYIASAISKNVTSAIHPRVAVLLGVAKSYHLPLLFCRALSTAPALWWGIGCILSLFGEIISLSIANEVDGKKWSISWNNRDPWNVDRRFRVTEMALSILWCCASAYLSFFFTDCLMSRWLINYTPQATLIRLIATDSTNAYITSWVVYLFGANTSPRQMLPAWISIASTLTVLYHLTQRKTNIRRETSASISVFSIASFISMIVLLLQLYLAREHDNSSIPLVIFAEQFWDKAKQILSIATR